MLLYTGDQNRMQPLLQFMDPPLGNHTSFPWKSFETSPRGGEMAVALAWSAGVLVRLFSDVSCEAGSLATNPLNVLKRWHINTLHLINAKIRPKMLIIMSPWWFGGKYLTLRDNTTDWIRAKNTQQTPTPIPLPAPCVLSGSLQLSVKPAWQLPVFPQQIKPFKRQRTFTGCLQPSGFSLG